MFPPRKDLIPNQDIKMLGTKRDQIIPPQLAKLCPGYKSLINKEEDGCNDSTDISRTDKEYSVDNLKSINNKNIDEGYKDENSQHHNSNESVIKKLNRKNHLLNSWFQ